MKGSSAIGIVLLVVVGNSDTQNNFLGLNKPFFNPSSSAVIQAQVGSIAYLTCEVYNLNNLSVSWVRGRDSHILTVDRETFIFDNRFISIIKKEKIYNLITLVIYEVQIQDQGNYECEVSSNNIENH